MTKQASKPRRPREVWLDHALPSLWIDDEVIRVGGFDLYAKEARRLARWLEKAADYLEGRKR